MQDEVRVMLEAADAARQAGPASEALTAYRQAARLARSHDDRDGLAAALRQVADLTREMGEPAESLIHAEEAAGLYRALGDHALDLATSLRLAALALEALGRDDAAHWREAQALYEQCADQDGVAECAAHLAG